MSFRQFFSKLITPGSTVEQKKPLTLTELLNGRQPYKEFNRLQATELSKLDNHDQILSRIQGSLIGLAVGDALGASVEFRPNAYMQDNPVKDMQNGGTWGLHAGQWTDDTSMALCLAASLIVKGGFDGYDQLVRYKRWYRNGYMSSTGTCFDIGAATRTALTKFESRQQECARKLGISDADPSLDRVIGEKRSQLNLNIQCGGDAAAGNGPLMRLAPIPLFYHLSKKDAIQNAASSASLTHGDKKAIDACRFYSALIWDAIHGVPKKDLLDEKRYRKDFHPPLDKDVMKIVEGSYKNKQGYKDGIRGTGFVVNSLEAALWAFHTDNDSFETGVLSAVNLGDDTDTTAAIYGQLAGAVYGIEGIPQRWRDRLFQRDFIITLANGLYMKGNKFRSQRRTSEAVDDDVGDTQPAKRKPPASRSEGPWVISE